MNTPTTEFESWHPPQSGLAIEYTRAVLDEIRDQTVAGYRRLSRGGVEVGGVLYGVRAESKVRIVATQPIPCEYRSGPTFILSDKDKARLRVQLAEAQSAEGLKELSVVGWYVSHPRGAICLTERDLEIFNEFFPDIWNIALVMKPGDTSVRGGFFVREPHGALNFSQSYEEFELSLPRNAEGRSAVRQIADQVSSSLDAQRSDATDDASRMERRRGGSRRGLAEMPAPPLNQPTHPFVTGRALGGTAAAATAQALEPPADAGHRPPAHWSTAVARPRSEIVAQRRLTGERSRRLKWSWLVMWALLVASAVAGAFLLRDFNSPPPLGLHVSESDGDLSVQWNAGSRSIQFAERGTLEIEGSETDKTAIALTKPQLRGGAFLFSGAQGDTTVRLAVTGRFGFQAAESTRYVARAGQTDASHPAVDRGKGQSENRRLREELDKARARIKELESLLYNR